MAKISLGFNPSEQEERVAPETVPAGKYRLKLTKTDYSENNGWPVLLLRTTVTGATDGRLIGKQIATVRMPIPDESDQSVFDAAMRKHGDEDKAKKTVTANRIKRENVADLMRSCGHPLSAELDTDLLVGEICVNLGIEKSNDPQYPDRNIINNSKPGAEWTGNTDPSKAGASGRNVVKPLPGAKNAPAPTPTQAALPSVADLEADDIEF